MLHPFGGIATQDMGVMLQSETNMSWTIESSLQWGQRNGLEGQQLLELQEFSMLIKSRELSSGDLKGGTTLDSGSFGIIEKTMFHGSPVAVKRFIKDQSGSKSLAQILRDAHLELSILCTARHPHIVDFLGVPAYFPNEADPDQSMSFGFVFEFCAHGSLFSLLHEKQVKFPFRDKIRMAKELAMAVAYLHSENIIHRDLSSRNILLTDDLRVKLADFGCARRISGEMYQPTTISGNPPWMSPEQLGGFPLTLSADVWSFGVVFWEFITEFVPWNDVPNDLWAMRKLIFDDGNHLPIPQLSSSSPETKDEATAVAMLINKTFLRSPTSRPPMTAIVSALQALHEQRTRAWIQECVALRQSDLEERLSYFFAAHQLQAQTLPTNGEVGLLAKLHCEDLDDNLINLYLKNKYKADLTMVKSAVPSQPRPDVFGAQARYKTGHCNGCPHHYGEPLNGLHEILMPGGSRYVGDLLNGQLHGIGILTVADGSKLQGEFQSNQLVKPFSVENMRHVLRPQELTTNDTEAQQNPAVPNSDNTFRTHASMEVDGEKSNKSNIGGKVLISTEKAVQDGSDHSSEKTTEERSKSEPANKSKPKSETYTCRDCPHFYGESVNGHHEILLSDGSRYVGDALNGAFHGLGILTKRDSTKLQGQFQNNQLVMPFLVESIRCTLKPTEASCDPQKSISSVSAEANVKSASNVNEVVAMTKFTQSHPSKIDHSNKQSPNSTAKISPNAASNSKDKSRMLSANMYNDLVSSCMQVEKQYPDVGAFIGIEHPVFELANQNHQRGNDRKMDDSRIRMDDSRIRVQHSGVTTKRSLQTSDAAQQQMLGAAFTSSSEPPRGGTPGPQLNVGPYRLVDVPRGGTPGPQQKVSAYHIVDIPRGGTPGPQRNIGPQPNDLPRNGTPGPIGNFSSPRLVEPPRNGTPGPQYNYGTLHSVDAPRGVTPAPQAANLHFLPSNAILIQPSNSHPIAYTSMEQAHGRQYQQPMYAPPQHVMQFSHQSPGAFATSNAQYNLRFGRETIPEQSLFYEANVSRPPFTESRMESRQNVMRAAVPQHQNYANLAVQAPMAEKRRLVETNRGVLLDSPLSPQMANPVFVQPGVMQHPMQHMAPIRWQ